MLSVRINTNTYRGTQIVSSEKTPVSVLTDIGFDFSRTPFQFDGAPLTAAEMNKSFEALGATDGDHFLVGVANKDNA